MDVAKDRLVFDSSRHRKGIKDSPSWYELAADRKNIAKTSALSRDDNQGPAIWCFSPSNLASCHCAAQGQLPAEQGWICLAAYKL